MQMSFVIWIQDVTLPRKVRFFLSYLNNLINMLLRTLTNISSTDISPFLFFTNRALEQPITKSCKVLFKGLFEYLISCQLIFSFTLQISLKTIDKVISYLLGPHKRLKTEFAPELITEFGKSIKRHHLMYSLPSQLVYLP